MEPSLDRMSNDQRQFFTLLMMQANMDEKIHLKSRHLHSAVLLGNVDQIDASDIRLLSQSIQDLQLPPSTEDLENGTLLTIQTILCYLFENLNFIEDQPGTGKEIHSMCLELLAEESLFLKLVEFLKSDNSFLAYSTGKCLISILNANSDKDILRKRANTLSECYQASDDVNEQNRLLSVLANIFSNRISNSDLKHSVACTLQSHWEDFLTEKVTKIFPGKSCAIPVPPEHIMPFLILWKKLVKYEQVIHHSEDSISCPITESLNKTPTLFLRYFECDLHHLALCKVFGVLITILGPVEHLTVELLPRCGNLTKQFLVAVESDQVRFPTKFVSVRFGGSVEMSSDGIEESSSSPNFVVLRKICLAVMKSALLLTYSDEDMALVVASLEKLRVYLSTFPASMPLTSLKDAIFYLFSDQDDSLIEVMFLTLLIHQQLNRTRQTDEGSAFGAIQPHEVFLDFLGSVVCDHSVILDLLTSPETCFLLYSTRYLRFIINDWDAFVRTTKSYKGDRTLSILDEKVDVSQFSGGNETGDFDSVAISGGESDISDCEIRSGVAMEKSLNLLGDTDPVLDTEINNVDSNFAIKCEQGPTVADVCPKSGVLATDGDVSRSCNDQESGRSESLTDTCLNSEKDGENLDDTVKPGLVSYSSSDESDLDAPPVDQPIACKVDNKTGLCPSIEIDNSLPMVKSSDDGVDTSGNPSRLCRTVIDRNFLCVSHNVVTSPLLDKTMTMLIRLRMAIQRLDANGLFPYDPRMLVSLIENCEDLYES